jgi:hypothetical protein
MEEFERELGGMSISKPKKKKEVKIAEDEDEEEVPDGAEFEEIDETELGDNPFAMGAGGAVGAGSADTELWLGSDRDYTYQEVGALPLRLCHNGQIINANPCLAAAKPLLPLAPRRQPRSRALWFEAVHPRAALDPPGRQQALRVREHRRHLPAHAPAARARHRVYARGDGHHGQRGRQRAAGHPRSVPAEADRKYLEAVHRCALSLVGFVWWC